MTTLTVTLNVVPFAVPECVTVENTAEPRMRGSRRKTGVEKQRLRALDYPLEAVDSDTLATMCDDFTTAVFAAAGKARPPK